MPSKLEVKTVADAIRRISLLEEQLTFFRREAVARMFFVQAEPRSISDIAKRCSMAYYDVENDLRDWICTQAQLP
jgi:hypothetical protein